VIDPKMVAQCEQMIRKGSLSFSLASRLLSGSSRQAIYMLYAWCRRCDDMVDKCESGIDEQQKQSIIAELREKTIRAANGQKTDDFAFDAMGAIMREYEIPEQYPLDLLAGMNDDLHHRPVVDEQQLMDYCYKVAGTVGLMFSHIVGINHASALKLAAHLGMAMQITNISRDVFEDWQNGRSYLPSNWLMEEGVDPNDITNEKYRAGLVRVVERALKMADTLYSHGDDGLQALSFRTALAVSSARRIYAEIGKDVRERGVHAWQTRTWIPLHRKLKLVGQAAADLGRQIPKRWSRPHQKATIKEIWRFEWQKQET
jgi:phytoene synthase